tara:strand:- start:109 stop:501 length:393 start_codon:yes stop_codon:yes gene_type:complete
MKRYYLATSTKARHGLWKDVKAILEKHAALELDWTVMFDNYLKAPSDALRKTIASSEIACVKSADIFVLLLPGGYGTMVEFGAAYAAGKPIIVFDPYQKMGVYHFLHLPGLQVTDNLEELESKFVELCEN